MTSERTPKTIVLDVDRIIKKFNGVSGVLAALALMGVKRGAAAIYAWKARGTIPSPELLALIWAAEHSLVAVTRDDFENIFDIRQYFTATSTYKVAAADGDTEQQKEDAAE